MTAVDSHRAMSEPRDREQFCGDESRDGSRTHLQILGRVFDRHCFAGWHTPKANFLAFGWDTPESKKLNPLMIARRVTDEIERSSRLAMAAMRALVSFSILIPK